MYQFTALSDISLNSFASRRVTFSRAVVYILIIDRSSAVVNAVLVAMLSMVIPYSSILFFIVNTFLRLLSSIYSEKYDVSVSLSILFKAVNIRAIRLICFNFSEFFFSSSVSDVEPIFKIVSASKLAYFSSADIGSTYLVNIFK